jgi:WD40 repeat protein
LPVVEPATYDIDKELARGGLGRVIRAHDRRLERTVAIKELLPGSRSAEARFVREARITARLEHPSIVPVHEAGRWPTGQPFYAMKLVSGRSLAQVVEETKSFGERLALVPKVTAVAEAIAYAHSKNVIHRDIKPSNVIVGQFGETVVIDWGLAKELDDSISQERRPEVADVDAEKTVHGEVLGTPNYMPPEQARGMRVDERSDVYALGSLLYQVLAGVPPYAARGDVPGAPPRRAAQILEEVVQRPPMPLEERQPQVPEDLLHIVHKAMARDPADRYTSARQMAEDLRRFEAGQLISARRYSPWALVDRWVTRNWAVVTVVAVAFLLLLAGGVWSLRRIIVAKGVAEGERAYAEQQRALAQEARAQAEGRENALILLAARSALDRDPTATLAWLKQYPRGAKEWQAAQGLATEAWERGVARDVWRGHHGGVWKAQLSPDGRRVASASADRSIGVFDVATGEVTTLTGHDGEVNSVAFSPDGKLLASASDDGMIWIWTLAPQPHRERILAGHDGTVSDVAFFPDSRRLATIGYDRTVRVWDVVDGTGSVLGTHDARGWVIAVSPDGRYVASGGDDRAVRVWDVTARRGQIVARRPKHITGVAFSARDTVVALSGDGSVVRVAVTGGPEKLIADAGPNAAYALAVSPAGDMVATAGTDHVVRLFDLDTGGVAQLVGHAGTIVSLDFSRDGKVLVTGSFDNSVRVWELRRADEVTLRGHDRSVNDVKFLADGTVVSVGGDGEVRVWDAHRQSEIACQARAPLQSLAVVPGRRAVVVTSLDQGVMVCDLDRHDLRLLGRGIGRRSYARVSYDGRRVIWTAEEGGIRIRDVDTGRGEDVPVPAAEEVALSPDGHTVAVASRNEVVTCDIDRCAATLRPRDRHDSWVRALAFSPDRRFLASAGSDRTVRVIDLAGGDVRVYGGHTAFVRDLDYSPDGRYLVSAAEDTTLRLVDTATGEARVFAGHDLGVARVTFSPDGTLLASLSNSEHSARLWELATGRSRVLRGHSDRVNQLAFSPDGKTLATASDDGTIRLWQATTLGPVPQEPDAVDAWLAATTHARVGPKDVIVNP